MFPQHDQHGPCAPCADKGFEYEMLQGKTGSAVNDLYTPEIKAATTGYDTNQPPTILAYDDLHTQVDVPQNTRPSLCRCRRATVDWTDRSATRRAAWHASAAKIRLRAWIVRSRCR